MSASELTTSDLDVNGQDDILLSFPGYGLWAFSNGTTWIQIHGLLVEAVVEGELNSR